MIMCKIKLVDVFMYEKRHNKLVVTTDKIYNFRITNRTKGNRNFILGADVLVNVVRSGNGKVIAMYEVTKNADILAAR